MTKTVLCRLEKPKKTRKKKQDYDFKLFNEDGSENIEVDIGQDEWPYKYPKGSTLTWKLLSLTDDIGKANIQQYTFSSAFRSMGLLCKLKFRFERDFHKDTDITIEFTSDLSVFDNRPGVLAQAYLYAPNSSKNGIVQFNDNHFFTPDGRNLPAYLIDPVHYKKGQKNANGTLKMLGTMPMQSIAMHELRHTLGGRHDLNSEDSLQYPYVKQGYKPDINGIWKINPQAFVWSDEDRQWFFDNYEERRLSWWTRMRWVRYRLNMGKYNRYYDKILPEMV